ncbi:MAG: tetratricopeptide repeat protein [Gemmatimonadaceae bacterium]
MATGACFATREDVRVLQNDIGIVRAEIAESDSLRRVRIDSVISMLARVSDSLSAMNWRFTTFQGESREEMFSLGQQLIQIQELTGQSQRRLQELRASLEERSRMAAAEAAAQAAAAQQMGPAAPGPDSTAAPPGAAAPGAPPLGSPAGPGPNELLQLALEQLRRGSASTARVALEDLLTKYPDADIAGDAQFYIAESYAQEQQAAAADSAYALVLERYPESTRAPTALYKRALLARDAGRMPEARAMLDEVVRLYPRSDEAVLARDILRTPQ